MLRPLSFGITLGLILVRWGAIDDGLMYWFGMDGFLTSILSAFITSIPVIGTITSIVGAMEVWGWSFWQAGCLSICTTAAMWIVVTKYGRYQAR